MLDYNFEDCIGHSLYLSSRVIERALDLRLAELHISRQQAFVLLWMNRLGEPTQAELAERLRISAPTLAGILDRMERDDLIRRSPDCRDRRSHILQVTQEGERLSLASIESIKSVEANAMARLSKQEVDSLIDITKRVTKNLSSDL